MSKPTKSVHEGKQLDAEDMSFKVVGNPEFEVEVEDGTTLKVHFIVSKVVKLTGVYNQEGEPTYQLKWGTGVTASVPAKLMKPLPPAQ